MKVTSLNTEEELTGTGKLKIKSSELESVYGWLTPLGFDGIKLCIDSPGVNEIGVANVMIQLVLHVEGKRSLKDESALSKLRGKLEVSVNSDLELTFPGGIPTLVSTLYSGAIILKKGEVKITIEEEE